ncbi:MAG: PD-(D/E)XK nuclease family protein [Pseudomonadota bacterium]
MTEAAPLETTVSNVCLVPYHQDPFAPLAEKIFALALNNARVVVLLPDLCAAPRLRRFLSEHAPSGFDATLNTLRIDTLRGWIERATPVKQRVSDAHARRLMLVEALMQHPGLFGADDPWRLADSLLRLFEQLSLRRVDFPADLDAFTAQLARGYGARAAPSALGREARIVHTLWQAWLQQLRAEHSIDPAQAYVRKLAENLNRSAPPVHFFAVGFHDFLPAELTWCEHLRARGQLTYIFQGNPDPSVQPDDYHPDAPLTSLLEKIKYKIESNIYNDNLNSFINSVYAPRTTPLRQRARQFADAHPVSPAQGRLRVAQTVGSEHEACAVDAQVRRWLAEGKRSIGIVTENRRLARRVRALLERSNITLQDAAGWALSTTSAATAVERWLQTVEEDFACLPLLDLLKSPFIFPEKDRAAHLTTVYRFEQDVILHENVGRNLTRYRRRLHDRLRRLPAEFAPGGLAVAALLDEIEQAAAPLLQLLDGARHAPEAFLDALQTSLRDLGVWQALANDDAGATLIQEIETLRKIRSGVRMDWRTLRAWLRRGIEGAHFLPAPTASPVHLLGLAQSALCRFDALIIAGADREHLPGAIESSPFFNSAVQRELGLPNARDELNARFHRFRCLLECAPQVLITVRREQDGEAVAPSPWLEALQAFHFLAYGARLDDAAFTALLTDSATPVAHHAAADLPAPQPAPRPQVAPELVPHTISASAYQELVNCPYQFFAARCLRLAPPESLREALQKSDYGERVHRILEAFHQGAPGLPGPFRETVTPATLAAARRMLEDISHAVFRRDVEDNFLHRGWLKRWLRRIPDYLAWQMERAQAWTVTACEIQARHEEFSAALALRGRLDRLDDNGTAWGIIDYKTGATPRREDIETGEAVQLPFYALLAENMTADDIIENRSLKKVERVEYLSLDGDQVKTAALLEGENLKTLKNEVAERLKTLLHDIRHGAPLPAWGDEHTCVRCAMSGVCRKQSWADNIS